MKEILIAEKELLTKHIKKLNKLFALFVILIKKKKKNL